jgi:hypothetical protein
MNKIKLPSNEVILYTLAAGGALTFAYAFLVIDGGDILTVTGFLLLLRGLVLGAAAGLGIAKISHALPRIPSKNARRYTAVAFGVMLAVAVPIVASVTYARMSPEMAALPSWVRVAVSLSVALFVDALTAGVALSSGKLEADDKPAATVTATAPATVATKSGKGKKVARQPVTDAQIAAFCLAHPTATTQEVADSCGMSRWGMSKRLAKLYGTNIKQQVTP